MAVSMLRSMRVEVASKSFGSGLAWIDLVWVMGQKSSNSVWFGLIEVILGLVIFDF